MIKKNLQIINKLGLHTRAAAKFVAHASRYSSSIQVIRDKKKVDGKSIMGVMMLAASQGTEIELIVDGKDEVEALNDIEALVADRFGEDA